LTTIYKEITRHEALAWIDALLYPVVQDQQATPSVLTELAFVKSWLIAGSLTGNWVGKRSQIAIWATGRLRFSVASEGMQIRLLSIGLDPVCVNGP
jgi:hypothetical protein